MRVDEWVWYRDPDFLIACLFIIMMGAVPLAIIVGTVLIAVFGK